MKARETMPATMQMKKGGYEGMYDGMDEGLDEGSFDKVGMVEGSVDNVGPNYVDGHVESHPAPKVCLFR